VVTLGPTFPYKSHDKPMLYKRKVSPGGLWNPISSAQLGQRNKRRSGKKKTEISLYKHTRGAKQYIWYKKTPTM
jgi:hypothetical protein